MPTPFIRRAGTQQKPRNHGLLLAGLEAGLVVELLTDRCCLVESSQRNGSVYVVEWWTAQPAAGPLLYSCRCTWAAETVGEPWSLGSDIMPCTHQLLAFYWQLPVATRVRIEQKDPALYMARQAGARLLRRQGAAGSTTAPVVAIGRRYPAAA